VGGRLVKFDDRHRITYLSPVLQGKIPLCVGDLLTEPAAAEIAELLSSILEMAAGLREKTPALTGFITADTALPEAPEGAVLSFSGGVAECIDHCLPPQTYGDIGPALGQAIRRSRLCRMEYRVSADAIRATVIGAGSHSAQLSGSTVFYRQVDLPIKNLPVVTALAQLEQLDGPGVLALQGMDGAHYDQIARLADEIAARWPTPPVLIALEADMAKALGHALALRLPSQWGILCIDRVKLPPESYLDVGQPVASALPVVVKTLILKR
jgi:ethanolamine utilization protein EutA